MAAAAAVGNTFTYQGGLNRNNAPSSGSFDLKVELFDVAAGGIAAAAPIEWPVQVLSNGLFTAPLDFDGTPVFDGPAY